MPFAVKQLTFHVWPKLTESISCQVCCEAPCATQRRIARSILTSNSPGIGKKVIAHVAEEARVSRVPTAVAIRSNETRSHYVFRARSKAPLWRREVPWILTPYRSQRIFDSVTCGNSGKAHAIPFPKTLPVGVIFFWSVQHRSQPGAERPGGHQTYWPHGGNGEPFETFLCRYGLVSAVVSAPAGGCEVLSWPNAESRIRGSRASNFITSPCNQRTAYPYSLESIVGYRCAHSGSADILCETCDPNCDREMSETLRLEQERTAL